MLLTTCDEIIFNLDVIKRGGFIRCRCKGRDVWQNALVSYADGHLIKALTFNGAATAYLRIPAADVNAGLWDLVYSNDLGDTYATDTQETEDEPDAG